MDALTFLREDHKSVLGMFEALDGAPTGTGAASSGLETMVTNLIIAESQHEAIEEQFFWPLVRELLDDGDQLADEASEQEQAGKQLLQILEDGAPGEPEYQEALQQFVQLGRDHIAFEQDVVWPRLREVASMEQLASLGEKLETAKKIAPTRPHPAWSACPSRSPRARATRRRSSTTGCRSSAPTGSATASSRRCSRPATRPR